MLLHILFYILHIHQYILYFCLTYSAYLCKRWWVLSIFLVSMGLNENSVKLGNSKPSAPVLGHARSCTELQLSHKSQRWLQTLGQPPQRHQRSPPSHALQSQLSIPPWGLPEFIITSALPWFRRALCTKVRLTSPSLPTSWKPSLLLAGKGQEPEEVVYVTSLLLPEEVVDVTIQLEPSSAISRYIFHILHMLHIICFQTYCTY